jgi:ubiquinol-cytochrome c reductase cytochrome c subunit
MRWLLLLLTICSVLAAQTAATDSKSGNAPSGNAQHGQKIFADYGCYQCHGREAQGGLGTGAPRLGPRPIAFVAFTRYVRQPAGQMPPYTSKVVSDQDLADIYAFLQARPQPPPAKSIPLLNN